MIIITTVISLNAVLLLEDLAWLSGEHTAILADRLWVESWLIKFVIVPPFLRGCTSGGIHQSKPCVYLHAR